MIDLYRLCEDLREDSPLRTSAAQAVSELYALLNDPSGGTRDLTAGWREAFRTLYGDVSTNLSSNRKLDQEARLARYGITGVPEPERAETVQTLFFAVQTYFSLLVKAAAWDALGEEDAGWEPLLLGTFASRRGAVNYGQADWFCWPLFELERGGRETLEGVLSSLAAYHVPFRRVGRPDCIKLLYEAVIPRELRRALGEFYTPDWLAEEAVGRALEGLDVETAVLTDPTCGSGTFLLQAIARKRERGCGLSEILSTVYGLDVNPLAVLAAKTNYLLAVLDLLDGRQEIVLPVWQADVLRLGQPVEEPSGADFRTAPAAAVRDQTLRDWRAAQNVPRADLAAGNPPWVNWEYLPESYRADSRHLWAEYGLMSAKGLGRSFSKEDISTLVTYVVLDKLVREGGVLAFVIRQGMFKSARNGAAFRRFRLRDGEPFRALLVEDLSRLRVFGDAAAGTAVLYARKGAETVYPVPYDLWERPKSRSRPFSPGVRLEEALAQVRITRQWAVPAAEDDPASVWITAEREALDASRRVLGTNGYRARTGIFTGGANAVYWLNIQDAAPETVTVSNLVGRAKRRCGEVTAEVEKDYVYPLVKGGGLRKWRAVYDAYLLCPHTAETKIWPVPQEKLRKDAPRTFAYLSHFRPTLDSRNGFAGWEKFIQQREFHALLRVGAYTFSPYKVVWRYIASEFICAVISSVDDPWLGERLLLPNEKLMYVSTEDEGEAYYLCGLLSSAPVAGCVKSYMTPTSISAHVLNKLYIPPYDRSDPLHAEIARVCKAGHEAEDPAPYAAEADRLSEELYGRRRTGSCI